MKPTRLGMNTRRISRAKGASMPTKARLTLGRIFSEKFAVPSKNFTVRFRQPDGMIADVKPSALRNRLSPKIEKRRMRIGTVNRSLKHNLG